MTTVIVTNIAPGTSEATITEFFGFCGRIVNIRLEDGENTITAYITFETTNAANTSLLLANAMIADRAIQVALDPAGISAEPVASQSEQPQSGEFPGYPEQSEDNAGESLLGGAQRAEPNAATHIIAQMLAAGYKLSDSAAAEAKSLDERFQISNRVQSSLTDAKDAITGFTERIGLSTKAQNAYTAVSSTVESTGVPQRASTTLSQAAAATEDFFSGLARTASNAIQSAAQTGAQWAEENLPGTVATLRQAGTNLGAQAETIRVEAEQLYPGTVESTPAGAVDASMEPEPAATTAAAITPAEQQSATAQ